MKARFLDFRGKVTTKMMEATFIWIYGNRKRAEAAFERFKEIDHLPNDEVFRKFCNADFWEALAGKSDGKSISLICLFQNLRNPDVELLHSKISNPEQLELLRTNFDTKKASSGLKAFGWIINRKMLNKGRVCSDFEITNATLVNWINFLEQHQLLTQSTDLGLENKFGDRCGTAQIKSNKLSLLESCALYLALNHGNPVDQKVFTKQELRKIVFPGEKNKNKGKHLTYEIDGDLIKFEIYPFRIFKMLLAVNCYDYSDEVFLDDWNNRDK